MGAFFNKCGLFLNENENGEFEGKVAQDVLRHFCFNGSGDAEKVLYKN